MKYSKLLIIMALLLFYFSSFATDTVVDDFNDGDNKNSLEGIWLYYDDTRGSGKIERLQPGIGNDQSSVIDVSSYTYAQNPGGGFDYSKRIYTFEVHEEEANKYGFMPFTLGDKWQTSEGKPEAFVGITTLLKSDSSKMDITDIKVVKFKLRSHLNNLKVAFIVETADIAEDSTYAYYRKIVDVSKGKWNDFEISISDLSQPDWTSEANKKDFNAKLVRGLTWEVSLSNNPDIGPYTVDTLDVDDILFSDIPNSIRSGKPDIVSFSSLKAFYSNNFIHLSGESLNHKYNGMITLLDAKGRVVLKQNFIAPAMNKISFLGNIISDGLYFIEITNRDNKKSRVEAIKQPIFIVR